MLSDMSDDITVMVGYVILDRVFSGTIAIAIAIAVPVPVPVPAAGS